MRKLEKVEKVLAVACWFGVGQASGGVPGIKVLTEPRVSSVVVVQVEIEDRIERGTAHVLIKGPGETEFKNIFLLRRDDPSLRPTDFASRPDGSHVLIVPAYFSMTAAGPTRLFAKPGRYELRVDYYESSRASDPPETFGSVTVSVEESRTEDLTLLEAVGSEAVWTQFGITREFVSQDLLSLGLTTADFILLSILEDLYTQVPVRGRRGWDAVLADLADKFPSSALAPYMVFHAAVSARVSAETSNRALETEQKRIHEEIELINARLGEALVVAEKTADPYLRGFILAELAVRKVSEHDPHEASRLLDDGSRNVGAYALGRQIAKIRQVVNRRQETDND